MILLNTLTTEQKISLMNGNVVGIFSELITSFDEFYDLRAELCLGYYMGRSGYRTISPMYRRFIKMVEENEDITDTADNIIARYIRDKFIEKWKLEYGLLKAEVYDPLDEYSETEKREGSSTEEREYDSEEKRSGNDSDTTTYNVLDETENTVKKREITTREGEVDNDFYGFNSNTSVPKDKQGSNSTITVEGSPEENVANGSAQKTGTTVYDKSIDNTTQHLGTDTFGIEHETETTRSGRRISGSELAQKELDFRAKNIFFDIVYRDIDSIITIPIYERREWYGKEENS